jgi:hypothetical protein
VQRIKKGENALIIRFLKRKDKTDFDRQDFSTLTVKILQNGKVLDEFTFPDAHLRAGPAPNEIRIEITKELSEKFSGGKVVAQYDFSVPDIEFVEDEEYRDIITEEILLVEQVP